MWLIRDYETTRPFDCRAADRRTFDQNIQQMQRILQRKYWRWLNLQGIRSLANNLSGPWRQGRWWTAERFSVQALHGLPRWHFTGLEDAQHAWGEPLHAGSESYISDRPNVYRIEKAYREVRVRSFHALIIPEPYLHDLQRVRNIYHS